MGRWDLWLGWPVGWRGVVSERSAVRKGGGGADGVLNDGEGGVWSDNVARWREMGIAVGICAVVVLKSFFMQ